MASTSLQTSQKGPDSQTSEIQEALIDELNEYSLHFMWFMRQNAIRAFEPFGIRPNKALLITLLAKGITHPKMISDALDIMPSAVSAMIAELEEKAWIERSIDPNDKRKVQLKLTKAGLSLHEKMHASWTEVSRERLQTVSEEDLQSLLRISKLILESNQDVLDTDFGPADD